MCLNCVSANVFVFVLLFGVLLVGETHASCAEFCRRICVPIVWMEMPNIGGVAMAFQLQRAYNQHIDAHIILYGIFVGLCNCMIFTVDLLGIKSINLKICICHRSC